MPVADSPVKGRPVVPVDVRRTVPSEGLRWRVGDALSNECLLPTVKEESHDDETEQPNMIKIGFLSFGHWTDSAGS